MKCSNCDSPALYVYDPKPLKASYFCGSHLPAFLRQAAKAGSLTVTDTFEEAKAQAKQTLRPRRSRKTTPKSAPAETAPISEEPVVDEPVIEDAPESAE